MNQNKTVIQLKTHHIRNVLTSKGQAVSMMKKCEHICTAVQIDSVGSTAISKDSTCPSSIPVNMVQHSSRPEEIITFDLQCLA